MARECSSVAPEKFNFVCLAPVKGASSCIKPPLFFLMGFLLPQDIHNVDVDNATTRLFVTGQTSCENEVIQRMAGFHISHVLGQDMTASWRKIRGCAHRSLAAESLAQERENASFVTAGRRAACWSEVQRWANIDCNYAARIHVAGLVYRHHASFYVTVCVPATSPSDKACPGGDLWQWEWGTRLNYVNAGYAVVWSEVNVLLLILFNCSVLL